MKKWYLGNATSIRGCKKEIKKCWWRRHYQNVTFCPITALDLCSTIRCFAEKSHIYDIRVTRHDSKNLSAEKRFFSFSVSTLLFFDRSGRPSCTGGRTLCRHFFYSCGFGKCSLLSFYSPCVILFWVRGFGFSCLCSVACYVWHLVLRVTHGLPSIMSHISWSPPFRMPSLGSRTSCTRTV